MIKLTNVSKSYARSAKKAVADLSLEVKGGEIFGFIGPNGAGKSTTIKMITGILAPSEGTVEIDGVNMAQNPTLAKSYVGFVPDNHETYETLKGIEYLNFIGTMYNVESALLKSRIDEYARLFALTDALPNMIASYSHGMKQKLMVIAALIHAPKVWVLDEPMTGLDPQSAFQLKQLMRKYADEGNTVFFSSHVIDVVEKVCDRIGIINHGELVAVDTLDNIRADSSLSLESIFLTMTSDATATIAEPSDNDLGEPENFESPDVLPDSEQEQSECQNDKNNGDKK
ncbi:MAG: ABC transporter ATP-binding protein [Corallococcus sp.]|nr:ABC transporter ATP-binding protein [Corallococcus sp.]MCM1359135.1 ABC transporter ATP-binding protein [Corallococcus sp.]MCM1394525.1 ABC transporter ATP-binding protein [Corallococcus sp.]